MARKQNVQRNVIERFADLASYDNLHAPAAEDTGAEPSSPKLRRFLRMVANRRQQILERMLMEED